MSAMQKMIQLDFRSRRRIKNPTPISGVLGNLTPAPPKNLRCPATPALQPCFKLVLN